jgi:hypothetical protein
MSTYEGKKQQRMHDRLMVNKEMHKGVADTNFMGKWW